MILSEMLDEGIIRIYKLMLTSKEWLQTVIGPDSENFWKARCLDRYAVDRRRARCSWFQTFIDRYLFSCLDCNAYIRKMKEQHSFPYLPNEPKSARLCKTCCTLPEWLVSTGGSLGSLGLVEVDVQDLKHHAPGSMPIYFQSELRKRSAEKKKQLEHAAQIKKALRLTALNALLADIGDVKLKQIANSLLQDGAAALSKSSQVRRAYEKLVTSGPTPTVHGLKALAELGKRAAQVEKDLVIELTKVGMVVSKAAVWPTQLAKTVWHDVSGPVTWLDSLMSGTHTIGTFIALLMTPCRCGSPAAVACPTGQCGRCCSGCVRHPRR